MKLPESWRETTVGNIVIDLQPGFAQKPGEEDEGTTPQIRTHNVSPDGKITFEGIKHISASVKEGERYTLKKGDVIFNNTNSEEWVGKTAVFDQEGEYVFSNHMTRLRVQRELVIPEYLASYLHQLWAIGYSKTRAKRWISQAGIETSALASFKIPLPTLPEQQRIVDVLRQAEAAQNQQLRRLQLDLVIKSALDRLVLSSAKPEWEQLGTLVEARYGTSVSADATAESGVAVLRIPNVMGGEVDTEDLKYVDLTQIELKRLSLTSADVLIVRSNGNPDYVGRSAPITEDIAKFAMVYASYLIRLRTDTTRLLPEYLSAFLNSAYGRAAMRNAIRTTAGQSNLSGENLTKVKLPVPPIAEQEWFRDFWLQVRELRQLIAKSESIANGLREALSVYALSGELTAVWRDKHTTEVADAANARDALLRQRGANIINASAEGVITVTAQADATVRPARHWLLGELSEFQRQVLVAFSEYCEQTGNPLLAEDPDVFAGFCDDEQVAERLQAFGPTLNNRIRRTLGQLAALGLIAKVTLPKQSLETGEREYLKAFRPLRPEESTRLADVENLRKALGEQEDSA
ncbi:restriction endonuclease subunit S [Nitrosomonas oligotropha]|uniref:restriction endonuclease subunit S n=1 Tax=Nitrosomonas oligotropha TaxID=42354 RepID=UPI00136AD4E7|nr:restriction endonuclease subunit S [Nitrosomonas oligotropha]MXS83110.1 restriction endonuclease subunit S [Nitrosomonas oligotropha]